MWTQTRMGGYAPNAPKGYRNKGVEPVDLGAQRWAQYPDLPPKAEAKPQTAGCTFTKPCKLPDGVINYASSAIPTDAISEYGQLVLLGGREADATGKIPLQQISGHALPAALGTLLLGGVAATAGTATGVGTGAGAGISTGTAATGASAGTTFFTTGVIAGGLAGIAALLWPSSLGDSSLYTPEQLKALKEGRTRVRLHIEQQADGTLKGYGYNTEKRSDWEMIPVARFEAGEISCVECKSSEIAPLTKNQKKAFPEIEKTGATVVGKGKPGFPGGTTIPPTRVEIIRPDPAL
ncbi:hypothetical protein CXQ81_14125 [Pseudomonas sp. 09C 129]|nr:hypothetical protein CXQ81_14125 [Pseudomonas sp. 09C 129]